MFSPGGNFQLARTIFVILFYVTDGTSYKKKFQPFTISGNFNVPDIIILSYKDFKSIYSSASLVLFIWDLSIRGMRYKVEAQLR